MEDLLLQHTFASHQNGWDIGKAAYNCSLLSQQFDARKRVRTSKIKLTTVSEAGARLSAATETRRDHAVSIWSQSCGKGDPGREERSTPSNMFHNKVRAHTSRSSYEENRLDWTALWTSRRLEGSQGGTDLDA